MATDEAPPEGGDSNRPMWSMLEDELRRAIEDEGEMVEPGRLIVRRLVARGLNGDMAAVKDSSTAWTASPCRAGPDGPSKEPSVTCGRATPEPTERKHG